MAAGRRWGRAGASEVYDRPGSPTVNPKGVVWTCNAVLYYRRNFALIVRNNVRLKCSETFRVGERTIARLFLNDRAEFERRREPGRA